MKQFFNYQTFSPSSILPLRGGGGRVGEENKKKVVVAMSGGVDSSVSAALLKEAGFDVVGVFMKFFSEPRINADKADLCGYENRCCSSEAENRARLVAEKLKIPFYVFNFEKEFKKKVVDYFLSELKAGGTPNPCVVCNKEIKFGLLIKKALAIGADYVATGHYCKIKSPAFALMGFGEAKQKLNLKIKESLRDDLCPLLNPPPQRGGGRVGEKIVLSFKLLRGVDKQKDQSYFLWRLNQKQLSKILFPVGGYLKSEVREMARKFNLPTAEAPESQEICFIDTTLKDFLEKNFKPKPGKIIDTKGNIIGEHNGLWFYTIGQRKGIKIKNSASGPFYVLDKDAKKNILIVTQNENDLYRKEMAVKDANWISGKEPEFPLKVKVKARYRQDFFSAIIRKGLKQKEIKIIFAKPQRAITPGQSAVFYLLRGKAGKGKELLGGGIIQ